MDEEEFLKRMGQKIRDLRNDKNWTLYDLEALTNIDSGDLSKIESGYTNSRILTIYKISQALNVSIDKLFDFAKVNN
ncbi:MAG: helix-turn-helix transcriptional regulator [Odoribacter sp.]|nr:helix-turn-helix transcriptional regulator [Odoribacter sp.]MDE6878363.1 helix-turn-helix domain-containing protein [Odoribacter sp.]